MVGSGSGVLCDQGGFVRLLFGAMHLWADLSQNVSWREGFLMCTASHDCGAIMTFQEEDECVGYVDDVSG